MYAIIRQYSYHPEKAGRIRQAIAEAQALHARQPGYTGSLAVDDGQRLTAVNLWNTERDADAGRAAIGPQVQRLFQPLMASPSQLIAAGQVVASDPASPDSTLLP
jgi:hypothetical protein